MAQTATTTIIFGQPGTGKSLFAKSVCNASSLPVFVINGQEKDYKTNEGFRHITFEDLREEDNEEEEQVKNCILIIDDLVRPGDIDAKTLNAQLVHKKRHDNITTFALAHGIEKNNVASLIKHFDYVMFSSSQTNTPIFKSYAKRYCPLPVSECFVKWEDFLKYDKEHVNYFRFNTMNSQFEIVDVTGNLLANRDNRLRSKILTYLSAIGETKVSMALYDYLNDVLPPGNISDDLQIILTGVKSRKKTKIPIIDFLHYVTTKKENMSCSPPRQEIIDAFKSLQHMYNIPSVFIGNHYF